MRPKNSDIFCFKVYKKEKKKDSISFVLSLMHTRNYDITCANARKSTNVMFGARESAIIQS